VGQKVYQHLLKSTALLIRPVRSRDGRVGVAMGSGAIVDRTNRLILTNYHVVRDSSRVFVFFPTYKDGKLIAELDYFFRQVDKKDALAGQVVFKDPRVDLALVQVGGLADGLRALPFAAAAPSPGTPVYSVGHPGRSGGLWIYTEGKVRQTLHKHWQAGGGDDEVLDCDAEVVLTDSPTNPGDSGGPLVNGRGELVAVVHGGDPSSNLMSLFISLSEVRGLLDRYARESGTRLALVKGSPLGADEDSVNVPDLLRALGHPDAGVRANAAHALGDLGANAQVAVPALLRALGDDSEAVRRLALEALRKIGAPGKDDVPLLVAALKGRNPAARRYAAGALGQVGPDARPAAAALVAALRDGDAGLRQSAARALGQLGPDAKERALPALLDALGDDDAEVRAAAAEGLAALPLDAGDVSALLKLLRHRDAPVRAQAARALGKVGPEARKAVEALGEAVQDRNPAVRQAALEGLAGIGPDAAAVVEDVAGALQDPRKEVRRAAVEALGGIGPEAKTAAKALAAALADPDLRPDAVVALGRIGPAAAQAREVVTGLVALLEERDEALRDKAVAALAKVGKPAVAALRRALADPGKQVRLGAAQALGGMGPAAKDALNLLNLHARADQDAEVRQECLKAAAKIQR
jgi:HEAT repeat protein